MMFLPCRIENNLHLVKIDEIVKIEIVDTKIDEIEVNDNEIKIKVYKEKTPHFFECYIKTKYLRQLIK